jgi:recombinational DNA repair protein (RecF pathway)
MVGVGLGHAVDPEVAARRLENGRCCRCGEPIEPVLFRLGSPRCHDCRAAAGEAPEEAAETWARMEVESYLRIWRLRNPGAGAELVP